jgi:hypothetical protein
MKKKSKIWPGAWLVPALEAVPTDLNEDELAAFCLTLLSNHQPDRGKCLMLILSMSLTYARSREISLGQYADVLGEVRKEVKHKAALNAAVHSGAKH